MVNMVYTDYSFAVFEDKQVGCTIYVDKHLPEAAADYSLNKTFFETKIPNAYQIPINQLKDCQC